MDTHDVYHHKTDQDGKHEDGNHVTWDLIHRLARRMSMVSESGTKSRSNSMVKPLFDQSCEVFEPRLDELTRTNRIATWKMAVGRSRKWIKVEKQEQRKVNYLRLSTLPFIVYALVSMGTYIMSSGLK